MKKTAILLCLLISFVVVNAQPRKDMPRIPLGFIGNIGQIIDQYNNPRGDIQFKIASGGLSVFVGNGQLHYQWYKTDKIEPRHKKIDLLNPCIEADEQISYNMYRLDMELVGANKNAHCITSDKQPYYEYYHTIAVNDSGKASSYNKITYEDIYPNIDWVLYIKNNTLEYDFIVKPCGNYQDIRIRYSGENNIEPVAGNIKLTTPFGTITEENLVAYEQVSGKRIAARFLMHDREINFNVEGGKAPLIIDPELVWGTYFGGQSNDQANSIAVNSAGEPFICGFTTCISNIATTGAYQTTYQGKLDVFVAKISRNGDSLLWATYYGGAQKDNASNITVDKTGNIYVTGFTFSTSNIATAGSHQTTIGGNADGFLAKFSSSGQLLWSTYFGGTNYEYGNSISVNAFNDVYLCGSTNSNDLLTTPGCYQATRDSSGRGMSFLSKFDSTGNIIWSTYFGLSTGAGSATSCICDRYDDVSIYGGVYDTGIYATPGCYLSQDGAGSHAYIAKFSGSGLLKWSTYFGGDGEDDANGITTDYLTNLYITGTTTSVIGIATPNAHQKVYGGGDDDIYVAKFDYIGNLKWGTYFGGNGSEIGSGIVCEPSGNIYLAGNTSSTDKISTPGCYQYNLNGISDAFLAQFNTLGNVNWSTYFGGSGNEGAEGVAIDGNGGVYIAGGTSSLDKIATIGCFDSAYNDSSDAFIVKFDISIANGINIIGQLDKLLIFPNPNNGNFSISVDFVEESGIVNLNIIDVLGNSVYKSLKSYNGHQLRTKINLPESLPKGVYNLEFIVNNAVENRTFFIN